ncbi:uncharacterized protein [Chelonus insularis]|uniref:uncharacterized protein isoform X2 n=1 Tax=Chelonus insularis TaxID=460826 RepID=UPI00158A5760|nr:uncharacterized protein LOC118066207 isoform X2 [Chelonus insularis]
MDDILEIKKHYSSSVPESEERHQLFRTFKIRSEKFCYQENEYSAEEEKRIKELKDHIQKQQEKLFMEDQKLKSLMNDLAHHNDILKELGNQHKELLTENYALERSNRELQSKLSKPSVADKNMLDGKRRVLDYYKTLTGVRWDYPNLKTAIKGYVTNNENYVHPFKFDYNDNLVEVNLWKEIERCAGKLEKVHVSEHKENSNPNQ